jgi:hypothetical protein
MFTSGKVRLRPVAAVYTELTVQPSTRRTAFNKGVDESAQTPTSAAVKKAPERSRRGRRCAARPRPRRKPARAAPTITAVVVMWAIQAGVLIPRSVVRYKNLAMPRCVSPLRGEEGLGLILLLPLPLDVNHQDP